MSCSSDYKATVPNTHDEEAGDPRPIKVSNVCPPHPQPYAWSLLGGGAPLTLPFVICSVGQLYLS